MDDIVTRLRDEAIKETDDGICYSCGGNFQTVTHYPGCVVWTVSEAADEIERLSRALDLAVGELSTTDQYRLWHPEQLRQQFLDEAVRGE